MTNIAETGQQKEIASLTGVRFMLVSMVFLIHYVDRLTSLGSFATGIVNQFYLSLHMFFVLSGFVICYKYYDQAEANSSFLPGYYLKRFSKIYPVFFVLTTLTYFVWALKSPEHLHLLKEWLLNISFIKGFSEDYYLSGIGPSWSLTVEEFFYFFSPFIFLLARKRGIFFRQVIAWWLIGAALLFIFKAFPYKGFFANAYFVYFATFFGRCFEFYCGIGLALLVTGKVNFIKLKLPQFRLPAYTLIGLAWMSSGILLLYWNEVCNNLSPWVKILLSNLFYPVGVALFYLGLIRERTFLQRLFSTPAFELLGKSSYTFFLVHTGVIAVGLEKYITRNVVLLFLLLQLISIVIFLAFERPVSNWIRQKGKAWLKTAR
jgi:peptidoglycan/LPS O-acetylase OafA/YrhL